MQNVSALQMRHHRVDDERAQPIPTPRLYSDEQ